MRVVAWDLTCGTLSHPPPASLLEIRVMRYFYVNCIYLYERLCINPIFCHCICQLKSSSLSMNIDKSEYIVMPKNRILHSKQTKMCVVRIVYADTVKDILMSYSIFSAHARHVQK